MAITYDYAESTLYINTCTVYVNVCLRHDYNVYNDCGPITVSYK